MKKKLSVIIIILFSYLSFGQVGINTQNPQGIFNVDGSKNNALTGLPTTIQQKDDFTVLSDGRVGIGTTQPNSYSMLDIISDNKGIAIPRVELNTSTQDLNSDGDNDVSNQPKGLLVYNPDNIINGLPQGFYFWNGAEWRNVDNSTAVEPSITNILCSTATLSPSSYYAGVSYSGNMKISYTGGNGGSYQAGSSVIINGLTFTLRSGKLEYGSGELVFSVSGIPTVSSPIATNIPINTALVPFLTSAQTCTATIGDTEGADIKVAATMGPLFATTDPSAGFHRYITSPDGKFSVRVVINSGGYFANADLQVRSNIGAPTIMWNANVQYAGGGYMLFANNSITFPSQGVWYGNGGGAGNILGSLIDNAWGDPDVYYVSPEWRRYSWTNTDPADKTMYILTFMMGAPTPNDVANAVNCPSGTCTKTKAFLRLEQIKAQ
jgi:hypothetical protein